MSRIAKKLIEIPQGTEVTLTGSTVRVKGAKGELSRDFKVDLITFDITPEGITVRKVVDTKETKALWGTYAAHLNNMIKGVNEGFQKKLVVEGVGFKSDVQGNKLVLDLGFSHKVTVEIPSELTVTAEKNDIVISGIDKELVGQFAAQVRAHKKPEPYKGKGIRYDGEFILRKQGKKSVA